MNLQQALEFEVTTFRTLTGLAESIRVKPYQDALDAIKYLQAEVKRLQKQSVNIFRDVQTRNEALEDAAKLCDAQHREPDNDAHTCAIKIRKLMI